MTGGLLSRPREKDLGRGWSLRLLPAWEAMEARAEGEELAGEGREGALCANACLLARALESGPVRISVAATRAAFSFCSSQTARRPWSVPTSTAKRLCPAMRAAVSSRGVSLTLSIVLKKAGLSRLFPFSTLRGTP